MIVDQAKKVLSGSDIPFHEGVVWSIDAIFRETREKVEKNKKNGVLAVEMETSALFTVGAYRDVEVCAILVVSDELSGVAWQPGFKSPLFKKKPQDCM